MLWKLFKSTFMISAFTFGGGYVIVPLLQKKFVEDLKWIEEKEMLDLVSISQSAPGAIAINTSVAVGYRMSGVLGAFVAVCATILPPMLLLMSLYTVYASVKDNALVNALLTGMQVGVCAVILDVSIDLVLGLKKDKDWISWLIFGLSLLLNIIFKINILVILLSMTLVGVAAKLMGGNKP